MADVIGEARKRVVDLKSQIEALQAEKNDGTMVDGRGASGAALKGILKKPEIRRVLKGHFGKVYAMHWAVNDGAEHIFGDSPKVLSASQDGKLMICACRRASGSRARRRGMLKLPHPPPQPSSHGARIAARRERLSVCSQTRSPPSPSPPHFSTAHTPPLRERDDDA